MLSLAAFADLRDAVAANTAETADTPAAMAPNIAVTVVASTGPTDHSRRNATS